MKWFIVASVVCLCAAEPPRPRAARFRDARFQRQELTTTDAPTTTAAADDAPYPAAGWAPAQAFQLPGEQPATSYGPPATEPGNDTATTTDNPLVEKLEGPVEVQRSEGAYYVLLPGGLLQRVALVPADQPPAAPAPAPAPTPAPRASRLQLRQQPPLLFLRA